MNPRLRLAAALAGLMVTLVASAVAEITVEDDWGRAVRLSEPAQRVAALSPHLVEALVAVDRADALVATVRFTDHPAAAEVTRVGDAFALSREALAATRPDLILVWGAALDPARLDALIALGAPVYVSDPTDLDGVGEELAHLARLTGGDVAAVARWRAAVARLGPTEAVEPVAVLPLISLQPPITLSSQTIFGDLLARCGARNPFADAPGAVIQLSRERLLTADVALVVLATVEAEPADADLPDGVPVRVVDPDLLVRPSPSVLAGARWLCREVGRLRAEGPAR